MTPRQRRRRDTEARIVRAAATIIAAQGLEALTMARIADAVDFTPGALYRYFKSKDAIFAALHQQVIEDFEAVGRARVEVLPEGTSPHRALDALVEASEAYIDFATAEPARFRLLAISLADPRQLVDHTLAQLALPAYLSLFSWVSSLFEEAQRTGALDLHIPPPEAAGTFVLALQGPLQSGKLNVHAPPGLIDPTTLCRRVVDALLLGWGAQPDVLDQIRSRAAGDI